MLTEREIAVRAVVETMRYLGKIERIENAGQDLGCSEWADATERLAAVSDWACCPFCSEVDCDDDCPLRHWRTVDTPGT